MPHFNFHLRATTLAIIVVFSVVAVLGFSLSVDLKPAQAFLGFGDIVIDPTHIATTVAKSVEEKIWDFAKGVILAFTVTFVANMAVKMMQKLESLHVIQNMLYYADALEVDQYIGNQLNKVVLKIDNAVNAEKFSEPTETNVASIAAKADLNFQGLSPGQVQELASYSADCEEDPETGGVSCPLPAGTGDGVVSCVANPNQPGCQNPGAATGSRSDDPCQPNDPRPGCQNPGAAVYGPQLPPGCTIDPARNKMKCPRKGLNQEQERLLLRGALALATGPIACGGFNDRAFRNVAIYNAAKNRGVDPRRINPRSGNYYTDLAKQGNPFASPDFQELAMRDAAAQAEARARQAVQMELMSNGLKSLRADRNAITRTSQTIADFISSSLDTALKAPLHGGAGGPAASAIGRALAQIVTQVIFVDRGRLVAENPYCGIAQTVIEGRVTDIYNGGGFDEGLGPGRAPNISERYRGSLINVDGRNGVDVLPIETVILTWSVRNATSDTRAFINDEQVPLTGTRTVGPFSEDADYRLFVTDPDLQVRLELGFAAVRVQKIQCGDGLDNDDDNLIDLADPGCTELTDDDETDPPPAETSTESLWNSAPFRVRE